MNNDLISREALKKALDDRMINFEDICRDSVFNIIDDTPTVDINKEVWNQSNTLLEKRLTYLKRPQGEWIELRKYDYKCSICGQSMMDKWNYCPNCGADMRVKEELKEKEG